MKEITLDVAMQWKQECDRDTGTRRMFPGRESCSKSRSCDRTWGVGGGRDTIGDASLSASIANSKVLVFPKSQTQGTFIKSNTLLPGTLYFN